MPNSCSILIHPDGKLPLKFFLDPIAELQQAFGLDIITYALEPKGQPLTLRVRGANLVVECASSDDYPNDHAGYTTIVPLSDIQELYLSLQDVADELDRRINDDDAEAA